MRRAACPAATSAAIVGRAPYGRSVGLAWLSAASSRDAPLPAAAATWEKPFGPS